VWIPLWDSGWDSGNILTWIPPSHQLKIVDAISSKLDAISSKLDSISSIYNGVSSKFNVVS
jgi:hypothetical protein